MQTRGTGLNQYYRFPISLGVEHQNLFPFGLSINSRYPNPSIPILPPTFQLGIRHFDSQDAIEPVKWDHTRWYGRVRPKRFYLQEGRIER